MALHSMQRVCSYAASDHLLDPSFRVKSMPARFHCPRMPPPSYPTTILFKRAQLPPSYHAPIVWVVLASKTPDPHKAILPWPPPSWP